MHVCFEVKYHRIKWPVTQQSLLAMVFGQTMLPPLPWYAGTCHASKGARQCVVNLLLNFRAQA